MVFILIHLILAEEKPRGSGDQREVQPVMPPGGGGSGGGDQPEGQAIIPRRPGILVNDLPLTVSYIFI